MTVHRLTDPQTKKPLKWMLISLGVLFGGILLFHVGKALMTNYFIKKMGIPPVAVSATTAQYSDWQMQLKATASLRAVLGVHVTPELAGMVREILFKPGAYVEKNTPLVNLNADPEIAQLHAFEADAALAKITYDRNKAQLAVHAVSQQTVDNDEANLKRANAQVEQEKAVIAKKTLRAAFSGRLGICQINPGQYLNPGDTVTTLETLDPLYADFTLPQQDLPKLSVGQTVLLTTDSFPGETFKGTLTTINSAVNKETRNVEVEATLANKKLKLNPGMFGFVTVIIGEPKRYLTVPETAISFNPYGEIIYTLTPIEKTKKERKKKDSVQYYTAHQSFVTTGDIRGDQIAVLQGLKEGDLVVTSGQLKLKNGSRVYINNEVVPSNDPNPQPIDQ